MLRSTLLCVCVGVAALASLGGAVRVSVAASDKECFFEDLRIGQRVGVQYEVVGGGQYDIDVLVRRENAVQWVARAQPARAGAAVR